MAARSPTKRALPSGRAAWLLSAVVALSWSFAAGCGDDGDNDGTGGAPTDNTGAGGGLGGGFSATSTGGFDSCAQTTLKGKRVPVQMYIMMDKSQSMLLGQKWAGASAALTAFFQDAGSAGLNIALRFFPDSDPVAGCDDPLCDIDTCAAPLVPLGQLNELPGHSDAQQQALVDAVASRGPDGLTTPTYAALAGAEQWAVAQATDAIKTAVVLVTDGKPNGCAPEDTASIAQLASDARSDADVFTYVIGMDGADVAQLDTIAAAGGTDSAFVIAGSAIHADLIAAFDAIGTAPIECSFPVPDTASAGQTVDPDLVNLTYAVGGDVDPITLPQVGDATECGSDPGWYYNDATDPTEIFLCPASCTEVQAGPPNASLDLVLGCATVVK